MLLMEPVSRAELPYLWPLAAVGVEAGPPGLSLVNQTIPT